MTRRAQVRRLAQWTSVLLLMSLLAWPVGAVPRPEGRSVSFLDRVSQVIAARRLLAEATGGGEVAARSLRQAGSAATSQAAGAADDVFNADDTGLPQNEESVTACRSDTDVVLEGTNDFRGLLDPQGNFTGWHLSTDGGESLANEGLLPPVRIRGQAVESGGDPVMVADDDCNLYATGLNYDFVPDADFLPNGIGVYKTTPTALASCSGGTDPSCWPRRRAVVANSSPNIFIDKPWMYVGESGGETVVWVVYAEFNCPGGVEECPPPFTNAIKAVRCDANLDTCTDPIRISRLQNPSIQFGDVTIGEDGRTYITWEEDNDLANNFEPPENMRFWLRVAPPGSTNFGPPRLVAREPLNLGFADLHANDFRIATYPKNEVATVDGHARVFVTWDGCTYRPLDVVCEEPQIKLRYSDDLGVTWSETIVVSKDGDNYFPAISYDRADGQLALTWFTNRFDYFHNRQDVELATLDPDAVEVTGLQKLTGDSNDPEADPLLGGTFIGDYIEVFAHDGRAWVGYNANYRLVELLGEGVPIPQQDNYLARAQL